MAGAFTYLNNEPFKIWTCTPLSSHAAAAAGTIIAATAEGITVQTGDGQLLLTQVQPAGKRMMDVADWLQGARAIIGVELVSAERE